MDNSKNNSEFVKNDNEEVEYSDYENAYYIYETTEMGCSNLQL